MLKNIFKRKKDEPIEVAGAILGDFTPEVENKVALPSLGDYLVQSYNNSSGTCSIINLLPLDSKEELRWLTNKQVADLMNYLQQELGGIFEEGKVLKADEDQTEYLSFELSDCKIIIFLSEIDGPMVRPIVSMRHFDAYEQLLREIKSFSSFDKWLKKRKIR